ncbi:MAG: hypothetical protein KGL39_50325 [Patescibacteria group bacterium]|nr:hypothetical protein [Patescibacteria group bacterium]
MNAGELHERADQIAENAFFKLISRTSMALAAPIVAVSLTWFGNTLWGIANKQSEIKGQSDLLAQQVGQLSTQISQLAAGKYTTNDAARDSKTQSVRDEAQDRRIGVLENRVDRLENGSRSTPR